MPLSVRLRERAAPIWEREQAHPFVRGLGDGTLEPDRFRVWLRQDYLFLIEYARVLAMAAARAEDLETQARFSDLLQATLRTEMDLHRRYARRFGISEADLERTAPAPTTQAYTDFLVRVALQGPLAAIVASLLPCAWGYAEIARRLVRPGGAPEGSPYAEWIRAYSSREFGEYADWLKDLLDRLADGAPDREQERLTRIFLTSSRYEYLFWEMCHCKSSWPV
ncbi:MAG: thiaminase II [Acidobacteriota bacterium]